ncbi:flagellar filament capping protein FliD [bacterium]|nr:flagellar filament capping protein FliD [bacterium]
MPTVNFSGLATGLDTGSIISQLVELKRAPIYRLQSRRTGYENQKKALDTLKSKLVALQDAAKALDTANEFSSLKTTVANEDALTVTAGSGAAAGTYEIEVLQLARAQKTTSQGYDSKLNGVGGGVLSFTVNGETTDLDLGAGVSLEQLAERINNDVAGVGASIVFDGSATGGYHLVLSAAEAGTAGAFSVDASGMSGGITPILTTDVDHTARDASLRVDGIDVVASSNNPSDVISGLTLNLLAEGEGMTTVTVGTDTDGIAEKVQTLVDKYNDLFSYVTEQSGAEGTLRDNPSLRSVASRVESIFTTALSGGLGDVSLFSQVGITRGDARQIKFDKEDFASALENDFGSVRDFFIERDGNLGKTYLIDQAVEDMTDSIDGLFRISNDALNKKIDYADQSIERYERSIESYQLTLERRFTAMEQMVSQLQAQGNYLTSVMYSQ